MPGKEDFERIDKEFNIDDDNWSKVDKKKKDSESEKKKDKEKKKNLDEPKENVFDDIKEPPVLNNKTTDSDNIKKEHTHPVRVSGGFLLGIKFGLGFWLLTAILCGIIYAVLVFGFRITLVGFS